MHTSYTSTVHSTGICAGYDDIYVTLDIVEGIAMMSHINT